MGKRAASSSGLDPSMRIIVLHGKERFLIEERTRDFIAQLDEHFGGVEVFSFDGETVQPAMVLDELRSYGLMQKHKLVVLDNADVFLAGGGRGASEEDEDDGSEAKSTRRPLMERYAENPVADATLLMRAATWRKGKLDKLILQRGAIIPLELMDNSSAMRWCIDRSTNQHGIAIERDAAQLLVERLGPELQHLDTELGKLAAMAGVKRSITRELVAESVGLSREEKAWEIQGALATGSAAAMLRKLRELLDVSRQDEVPIAWAICDFLRKVHTSSELLVRGLPPRAVMGQAKLWGNTAEPILQLAGRLRPRIAAAMLKDAIDTDMRNKSGSGDPQRNLETLVVRIADTISRR
ncbi:MAG: DNA polymerase III subunit delta [Phycisphaerales bacterium]|nr:DNA polymerase III subunit delta [Phycisphaerales bacterium]MCI0675451.1 DNA polymerase III subunit delta [Phycisphaerales bacterium]